MASDCPNCAIGTTRSFYRVDGVPVNSCLLINDWDEAIAFPRGDIDLHFCATCGFVHNAAFDPERTRYTGDYEETQGFSPTFSAFHRKLAEELIARHDLREKSVVEIGCGKGEFLTLLCQMGDNRGIGYDPGYRPDRQQVDLGNRLTFHRAFFTETTDVPTSDLICCKMTLEHIPETLRFVRAVRRGIGDSGAPVFFQIPDLDRILAEAAFWDIYYEHCSYFSKGALVRLFQAAGFRATDVWTGFSDQYLMIEAVPDRAPTEWRPAAADRRDVDALGQRIGAFTDQVDRVRRHWSETLRDAKASGRRVVLWGSGSKAVAFLTTLSLKGDEVDFVVDINPHRHGYYMAGTGQRIVAPAFLGDYRPDLVIVMNPAYRDEIAAELAGLGLQPEIRTV